MLTYTCDNCKEQYPTSGDVHDLIYMDNNKRYDLYNTGQVCAKCDEAAKKAALDALAERKKKE